MRVAMRKVVDVTSHPDIPSLAPLDRVITSIRFSWYNSSHSRNKRERMEDIRHRERLMVIEEFKGILLHNLRDLKIGDVKKLSISRKFDEVIDEVLSAVDFIKYDVTRYRENKDMLISFPELPIVLEVSLR